jgi:hypothetical protein
MIELILVFAFVGAAAIAGVLAVRWIAYSRWRRDLVAYDLQFARDLDATAVSAALTSLTGVVAPRWLRPMAARAVVFEVQATDAGIRHRVVVPRGLAGIVIPQLRATLAGLRATETTSYAVKRPLLAGELGLNTSSRSLRVDAPEAISSAILASLQPLKPSESVTLQWLQQPVGPIDSANATAQSGTGSDAASRRALRDKRSTPLFQATARLGITAAEPRRARQLLQRSTAAFHTANAPGVHLYRRRVPSCQVARSMERRA